MAQRRVGVRAGLDLEQIVEVARSLDPDEITMQALADRLGVDRKALNHHVSDRETLLALVAMDRFAATFSAVDVAQHEHWQDACRHYARGFTEAAIATGTLAERIRLSDPYVTRVLEPTEALLAKMVAAGFEVEAAMRAIAMLTNICLTHARDVVTASREGVRPRPAILRTALAQRDPAEFEILSRIAALDATTYDDRQLELSIEVFVAGAEAVLRTDT